jgi:DNA-binding NarL/FixJ family response regulator
MLTSYSDDGAVIDTVLADAAGYLLKQTEPERLIEAVETVAAGESLLDPRSPRRSCAACAARPRARRPTTPWRRSPTSSAGCCR